MVNVNSDILINDTKGINKQLLQNSSVQYNLQKTAKPVASSLPCEEERKIRSH